MNEVNYSTIKHVGIVLDGNRRWAKSKGLSSLEGHKQGAENLKKLSKYILNTDIEVLSVFVFSTENFKRTQEEVKYLMDLFTTFFKKYVKDLESENIRIVFSGSKDNLRDDVIKMIEQTEEITKNNTKGILNVCLNYGSHNEIIDATKKIHNDINDGLLDINLLDEETFNKYLYHDLPPIDLFIRTSGEYRISNFMLWQLSYAELYFTEVCFPDFDELEFDKAICEYNNRNRRFGGDNK